MKQSLIQIVPAIAVLEAVEHRLITITIPTMNLDILIPIPKSSLSC